MNKEQRGNGCGRRKAMVTVASLLGSVAALAPAASAQSLTIHAIQWTANSNGSSDYDGQVVDCAGGIVVGKYAGFKPRVILQDPANTNGWGGIQVKDWTAGFDLFGNVDLGDWVQLSDVLVEESWGTTMLHWNKPGQPQSGFSVTTNGLTLPPPILVPVSDVPGPISTNGGWYVENYDAERYESMRIIVRDVTVTEWDLGSHVDNYNLETPNGDNCWATDYMNEDVGAWGYHPFVEVGQHFCAVAGLFEQYTNLSSGWDYYQLITMKTIDLAICGDGNSDGDVDLDDWQRFDECFIGPLCNDMPGGCDPPAWTLPPAELPVQHCLMMDFDYDGDVDLLAFAGLQDIFGAE